MKSFIFLLAISFAAAIDWNNLEDAIATAGKGEILVLFFMSKSTCKPCKKLEAELESSAEFAELSKKFTLAKAVDDQLPKSSDFDLDGKYVPKILFLNGNGLVLRDVLNVDAKSHKARYFYRRAEHVVKSMNKALEVGNLDHGFGKDYTWYDWFNGLEAAKKQEKPILVIFHQDWCGACQRLKPKFTEATEVKELAGNFIMINTDLDEVVKGDTYKVDGEYYPKILFLDSDANVYQDEWNHGTKHSQVLHYYGEDAEIAASMKRVIANRTLQQKIEDHGFGKHIKWVKYQEGLKIAKEENKPMMLIIHKSYCGACKALKPRIRNDKEIAALSKHFVMVNCNDDEEPDEDQFDIDGAYIPRIFFIDNLGKVEKSLYNTNKDYEKTIYAYGPATQIVEMMKKALEMKLGERKIAEPVAAPLVNWYSYVDGLREAKKSYKAIMIVFNNNYCTFSQYMMSQINSPEVAELTKNFVVIQVGEDEASTLGEKFNIDGTYTPRIFFMDPDQNMRTDINNTGTTYTSTMFYYGKSETIIYAMNNATQKMNLTLGHGFGEYIQWVKYEKAIEVSKEINMPMMLIIHKQWCGACKALKPVIAQSRPIWELSYHFIMVNVEDEEEPLDNQFFIDGGYYPRIFFLDPQGKVHHDLHNTDPAFLKYKFSYAYEQQVYQTMRFAIAKLSDYPLPKEHQTPVPDGDSQTVVTQGTSTTQPTTTPISEQKQLSPGKKILADSGLPFMTIDEALPLSKESGAPIMFIIHRTTCPACKAVLKMISRDKDFKEKSAGFILADIEDDVDDAKADSYDVDGGYVPRIYFLDPEGKIIKEIWNLGTNYLDNKYYYYEMISIYRAMEKTEAKMETWVPGAQNETETKAEDKTGENENKKTGEVKEKTDEEKKSAEEKKDEL